MLGVCVGMQVMFEGSTEPSESPVDGVGEWPGTVSRLRRAGRAAHGLVDGRGAAAVGAVRRHRAVSGSTSCTPTPRTAGSWSTSDGPFAAVEPLVTWATHGERFVAAVENGPLSATQFHPEKSGEAGLALLRNWVRSL